ncbi:MAG: MASE1 domain-containing protein [Bdellovibrionota bacterium]
MRKSFSWNVTLTALQAKESLLVLNAVMAMTYFLTARFGISFGSVNQSASLIWAPSGIALAALLWYGSSVFPGIIVGASLTILSSRLPIYSSALALAANVGEPAIAAYLLRRVGFRAKIDRIRDAIYLILLGAMLAPALGALLGTYALSHAQVLDGTSAAINWETWWVGDFFGVLIITPVLLVSASNRAPLLSRPRLMEALVFAGFFLCYGLLVFMRQHAVQNFRELPVAFGVFPFAIWAALRFEQIGNVLLMFTVAVITLIATLAGDHVLPRSPLDTLLTLQIYISMAAGTGLILAAAIMESKRALRLAQQGAAQLLTVNERLEKRVKERTQELERGRLQLAEAQELAHVGSWEWDVLNDRISWSDELFRIYGLDKGELTFSEFINRIHPEDRTSAAATLREAAENHACYDFVYRIVRPDASVRTLHGRGSAQTDSNGRLMKMFGTAQDITGQKEAEKKLRRYLSEIQDLYNNAPCSYQSLNLDGLFIDVNDTEINLLGYSREDLVGKKYFSDLLDEESKNIFEPAFQRFRDGEGIKQLELNLVCKNGQVMPILMNFACVRDEFGRLIRCRASFIDLTERKKAEQERILAEQAEYARKAAESSAQRSAFLSEATQLLTSSLDHDEVLKRLARLAVPKICDWCIIDIANQEGTLERVLAHRDPEKEEIAKEFNRRFPSKSDDSGASAEVIRSGKPQLVSNITPSMTKGAIQRAQEYTDFVRSENPTSYMCVPMSTRGQALGAISFLSTISGRHFSRADLDLAEELGRRAALAIENARLYRVAREAVALRDEFLSIASHELKTPITSLKLRLQMAKRSLAMSTVALPDGFAKVFDISNAQVERLNSLIDDLLDVSRIQAGKLSLSVEELDLGCLLKEVVGRFINEAAAANCTIRFFIEPNLFGNWDRTRLEQVFVNLFSNAIKYAPGSELHIRAEAHEGSALLSFKDFGPGIPADKQESIFERYERAAAAKHTAGLGLGLFIVKQIVLAHQGRIWVESSPGTGSTFFIELPLSHVQQIEETQQQLAQA